MHIVAGMLKVCIQEDLHMYVDFESDYMLLLYAHLNTLNEHPIKTRIVRRCISAKVPLNLLPTLKVWTSWSIC